jgi:hypothetical protein
MKFYTKVTVLNSLFKIFNFQNVFFLFFLNKNQGYFGLFKKFCALICMDGSKLRIIESSWVKLKVFENHGVFQNEW